MERKVKSLKKFLKSIIALSTSIALIIPMMNDTFATSSIELLSVNELNFDSENTPESLLNKVENKELKYGDTFINKEDIQTGIDLENKMNSARMNEEVWNLVSSSTYKAYGPIKGKYKERLACGAGSGLKANFDLSIIKIVKYGIALSGSATFTFEYTRKGPTGNESVGNNHATHRYFVGVASAKIMKYNYRITDKYTGNFIRNQTAYVATNKKSTTYGVLGYYNAANDTVKIKSVANSKTKTYNEETFKNKCSTEDCWSYINF